jgi:signal transduction histidine kinase
LAALVNRIAQDFQPRLARAGVTLSTEIPPALTLEADAERLRRVFENLLTNALQVLPKGGQVTLRARQQAGSLRVDVCDDGPGVPTVIRERLFEPFISYGKPGGTGLGLAIARGIITAHQGQIGLEAATPRGAHFFLELPLRFAPHAMQEG